MSSAPERFSPSGSLPQRPVLPRLCPRPAPSCGTRRRRCRHCASWRRQGSSPACPDRTRRRRRGRRGSRPGQAGCPCSWALRRPRWFAEDENAAVPGGKTPGNGQGAVDAAVVDEDDLDVPQRLVHDAGKAVSDEGLGVPGSDDNGNGGQQEALRLPRTAFLSLMIRKRKVRDAGHGNSGTLFP